MNQEGKKKGTDLDPSQSQTGAGETEPDIDMHGEEIEDMGVGEMDLGEIEKACNDPTEGYIPSQQVTLLREVIIKSKTVNTLGITLEQKKEREGKRKTLGDNRGRRSNRQRINKVGEKLKASRLYPTIEEAFNFIHKITQ